MLHSISCRSYSHVPSFVSVLLSQVLCFVSASLTPFLLSLMCLICLVTVLVYVSQHHAALTLSQAGAEQRRYDTGTSMIQLSYIILWLSDKILVITRALIRSWGALRCPCRTSSGGGDIGGQGVLGPPTFYPGGAEHPQIIWQQDWAKYLLLARNLHCKKRINFQAQLIKQTRGFAFVF